MKQVKKKKWIVSQPNKAGKKSTVSICKQTGWCYWDLLSTSIRSILLKAHWKQVKYNSFTHYMLTHMTLKTIILENFIFLTHKKLYTESTETPAN